MLHILLQLIFSCSNFEVSSFAKIIVLFDYWRFLHFPAVYSEETDCVGFARLGSEDQMIVAGTMRQLQTIDFGTPLHCLVIAGKTHPVEDEMLEFYKLKGESLEQMGSKIV